MKRRGKPTNPPVASSRGERVTAASVTSEQLHAETVRLNVGPNTRWVEPNARWVEPITHWVEPVTHWVEPVNLARIVLDKPEVIAFRGLPSPSVTFHGQGRALKYQLTREQLVALKDNPAVLKRFVDEQGGAHHAEPPSFANAEQMTAPLAVFRMFCGKETRELVELTRADLVRDIRELGQSKHRNLVRVLILWRTWSCIGAVLQDSVRRKLLVVAQLFEFLGRFSRPN